MLTLGPAGKPTLTLMHFDDGRNTKDLPAKMVFYVQSPSAAVAKIRDGGDDVILSGAIGVCQVYGFDGYVLEFLQNADGPPRHGDRQGLRRLRDRGDRVAQRSSTER